MSDVETFEQLKNIPMPDPEALKKELEKKDEEPPEFDMADPRNSEEYTFSLNYTDGRGKCWKGDFTTKILTIKEEIESGLVQANLNNNIPKYALDSVTDELNFIISRTTYCLIKFPTWWKPRELKDIQILQEVYKEVASHEAFFRRPSGGANEG